MTGIVPSGRVFRVAYRGKISPIVFHSKDEARVYLRNCVYAGMIVV